MDRVKSDAFVVLLILLCATQNGISVASDPVSTSSSSSGGDRPILPPDENKQLTQRIVSYVCTLTNLFLEKVVQRNLLTEMLSVVDMRNVFAFLDSLTTSWNEWAKYLIGFVIISVLFLVLGIVVFLFDIIYLICLCQGRCVSSKSSTSEESGSSSKAFAIVCSVALALIAVGLIVGAIAMFTTNETVRTELSDALFDTLIECVNGITNYLDHVVSEVNGTIVGGFLNLENSISGVLQDAPMKATQTIANSTQDVLSNLNQLKNFTRQLDTLQRSFLDSQNLTQMFSSGAGQLTDALSGLRTLLLTCNNDVCKFLKDSFSGSSLNLDAFNIDSVLQATSSSNGLDLLVNSSLKQLTVAQTVMNATVSVAVAGLKSTSKGLVLVLSAMTSSLNKTLRSVVNVTPIHNLLLIVQRMPLYRLITEITYWSLFVLTCIVGIIALLNLIGLMMGWCLPSADHDPHSDASCGCNRSIGSRLFMAGIALTLIFYWIFALLLTGLFLSGGTVHTELCRHVVHNTQSDSSSVLSIVDEWVAGQMMLSPLKIRPFKIYSVCQNDRPIYEALDLAQIINMSQVTNSMAMVKSLTESFQAMPSLTLASPNLTRVMGTLASGFGESNLNFTKFYSLIDGNSIIDRLASMLNSSNLPFLVDFYRDHVVPLLAKRDQLVTKMRSAEAILSQMSFTNVTTALAKADASVKNAIPLFLSSTTNSVSKEVRDYIDGVVNMPLSLGRCRPVYDVLSKIVNMVCVDLLYPINGFWFGLGCCMLLLIPNLFLSLYLASAFG